MEGLALNVLVVLDVDVAEDGMEEVLEGTHSSGFGWIIDCLVD